MSSSSSKSLKRATASACSSPSSSADAFSLLMTSSKKRQQATTRNHRKRSLTAFVLCPAGCGRSMLEKDINKHLDQCLGEDEPPITQQAQQLPADEPLSLQSQSQTSSSSSPPSKRAKSSHERGRVCCPACEKSFPEGFINLHLDQCTAASLSSQDDSSTVQRENRDRGSLSKSLPEDTNEAMPPADESRQKDVSARNGVDGQDGDTSSENKLENETINQNSCESPSTNKKANSCAELSTAAPKVATPNEVLIGELNSTPEAQSDLPEKPSDDLDCESERSECGQPEQLAAKVAKTPPESKKVETINNVFATMMKKSKIVFAKKESGSSATVPQTLHFHDDRVSLVLQNAAAPMEFELHQRWSAAVRVKDKLSRSLGSPALEFDVTLSSAVASYDTPSDTPLRWVRRHSRLSVPVLKSILQKAIRRRRPLPAVRVAMELADKALGELLRRLPIIILEDSTLHPDFHFLMWIMMAHSKDFVPPPRLLVRMFQIIFEVASCQWSDPLWRTIGDDVNDDTEKKQKQFTATTTLTALYERSRSDPSAASVPNSMDSILWSILVRAEYGGMRGDVHMLHRYAQQWKERLISDSTPAEVTSRVIHSSSSESSLRWQDVPHRIHQRAHEQSIERVTALCSSGIDRLTLEDICVEGVDFHCSQVLDELLADQDLFGTCLDLLILAGRDEVPTSKEGRRGHLEGILKHCMWEYSSGVNRRRPLHPDVNGVAPYDKYKEMWNDLVAAKALAYQKKYVKQRLA